MLTVQILGPTRVWREGIEVGLGPARRRALFGLLALAAGQPRARHELIDALWGNTPPPSATNLVHSHVKHLRRLLEPARRARAASVILPAVGDGYALHVPAGGLDLTRFRELIRAAEQAGGAARAGGADLRQVAALLGEALALWRGFPVADVPLLAAYPSVVALAGERRRAFVAYAEAMLAVGGAAQVLPALLEDATTHPLDESAQARLMRALHATGQRAQAVEVYWSARRRLADELGVEPGAELTAAYQDLLVTVAAPAAGTAARPVPRQLPADPSGFVGRAGELAVLDRHLATAPVAVICGTAGVGKTTLAVRWAHRLAARFGDGQIYLDLRGYDRGPPLPPIEALGRLLRSLGAPAEQVPSDVAEAAAAYRSLTAGRRLLIVLDNARNSAQVRPLLPGGSACRTVVTSRDRLTGLVTTAGAHLVALAPLTPQEARQLMARRLGTGRVAAEPRAVEEIITGCGQLPLALSIVAARAAARPEFPIAALAGELRHGRHRLDALADRDPAVDVRTVFSWSYRSLSAPAARMFRQLGVHPGPDISVAAAASLTGAPPGPARATLAELACAHLVVESAAGRYGLHDLLRAYAADLAHHIDSAAERRAAVHRMLAHYLRSAHHCDQLLNPARDPITLAPPVPGVDPERPAGTAAAEAWFSAELAVLLAAVEQAVANRLDTYAWQLAWALATFLSRRAQWHELARALRAGLAAADRQADPTGQFHTHRLLATVATELGRYRSAHAHLDRALDLAASVGDRVKLGRAHESVAYALECQNRHAEALEQARIALALFQAAGHRTGQADALQAIGWFHTSLGDHRQAIADNRQALAHFEEIGDRDGQAMAWSSLGTAHHRLSDYRAALACYRRSLAVLRELGDRVYEAGTLDRLGDTYRTIGRDGAARGAWQRALDILDGLDHPDAAAIRTKLTAVGAAPAAG